MNSVASNYLALKYQKSTTSSSIDIGIRKFEFVTKTQFLCYFLSYIILLLSFLLFLFHSLYFCHFFYRPLQFGIMIFFFFRKRAPSWFPSDNTEPWDEGCGEGTERCSGLRGYWRTCSSHFMGSGYGSNQSGGL